MIGSLSGTLQAVDRTRVLVNTGTVGYWVFVPAQLLPQLNEGSQVELYIHTQVREDILALFGFLTLDDLRLFEKLLTVSGIGPKLALNVFAAGTSQSIRAAIDAGDLAFFTGVSGVGKKSASRLILDLKGKLVLGDETETGSELEKALSGFGFSREEIAEAKKKIDTTAPVADQLKAALKYLGS